MSDINIYNTEEFNNVTSYVDSCSSQIDTMESDLKAIGEGITDSEVKEAYNTAASPVFSKISSLRSAVSNATSHINTSLTLYNSADAKLMSNLNLMYDIIFADFGSESTNKLFQDTDINSLTLNYNEYIDSINFMEEVLGSECKSIVDNFKAELELQYYVFLCKNVPNTLNTMIDNFYQCNSEFEYGTESYIMGNSLFKEEFVKEIEKIYGVDLKTFDYENSSIPEYLLEDTTLYQKSLLMLTFESDDMSDLYFNLTDSLRETAYNDNSIKESNFDKYLEDSRYMRGTFQMLENTYDFFNQDFSNKKISEIKESYSNYVAGLNGISLYPISNEIIPEFDISHDGWRKTLEELGYIDNSNELFKNMNSEELYTYTHCDDFFYSVYENSGEKGLSEFVETYYKNINKDYINDDYISNRVRLLNNPELTINLSNRLIYRDILNTLSGPVNEFAEKAVILEKTRQDYKLGMLEKLDISDVTDSDIREAESRLGTDVLYLEDWQLKAYAKINKENHEEADKLTNDTLYYLIQSGRGYDYAKSQLDNMTGDSLKELMNPIIRDTIIGDMLAKTLGGAYSLVGGTYDGLANSIHGVTEHFEGCLDLLGMIDSEDRMNDDDYRKMYLQQFLSKSYNEDDINVQRDGDLQSYLDNKEGLEVLKYEYNLGNSVGGMVIPMALSSFVSPYASYAWMYASVSGNAKKNLLFEGKENNLKTYLQSACEGLLAVGSEKLLGSLKGIGDKSDDLLGVFKNIDPSSTFGKLLNTKGGHAFALMLSNSINETNEELFENFGNHVKDYIFEGKIPDGDELLAEMWTTVYMTMTSTPLINLMGTGFQKNKYSTYNRQTTNTIAPGIEATYSVNEMLKFQDANGEIDRVKFTDWLKENNRIKTDEVLLIQNTNNADIDGESHLIEIADGDRDTVVGTWMVGDEKVEITKEMLANCINKYGNLSTNNLALYLYSVENIGMQVDQNYHAENNIVKLAQMLGKDVLGDTKIAVGYNGKTGELLSATLAEIELFPSSIDGFNHQALKDYLIKNGRTSGAVVDGDNIICTIDGKTVNVDRKKLFTFLEEHEFSYEENADMLVYDQMDLSLSDLAKLIEYMPTYDLEFSELIILDDFNARNFDAQKMLSRLIEYYDGSDEVKKMLLWTRDELPKLYDCLGDRVSQNVKDSLKYSAKFFETQEMFQQFFVKEYNVTLEHAKKASGFNNQGDIFSFIDSYIQHRMVHEGNHSLGHIYEYDRTKEKWVYNGLNEALTESLSHRVEKANNTTFNNYIAYTPGTNGIDTLMDENIPGLTVDDFIDAYYVKRDISSIRNRIDAIMGKDYFDNTLSEAFDSILIESDMSDKEAKMKIDKVVSNIISTYNLQN